MRLAASEYARFADALETLSPDDWHRATDCALWDVRQVASHCLGMAAMAAGMREGRRQLRLAEADAAAQGIAFIDALTALQVREREGSTPGQLVDEVRAAGPRAARGRRMTPFFIRRRPMPVPQVVNAVEETWSIEYLVDVILTRDTWMHRIDLATATGRPAVLTAEHDGVLVADVVQEWADRHGRPHRLTLTGPAGGTWWRGSGGPQIEMDAVDFCRTLSGRLPAEGLLTTEVPF